VSVHHSDDQVTLYHGDCLDVLRELPDASVDAVVTDPPYGLEFMGKDWDRFGGGKTSTPGIGDRETKWVSNRGWNDHRCRNCGHLSHGGSPCRCDAPDFARADNRWPMFQQWCEQWATECLRVLKPGGYMLAFGGSRTWHRLTCAIEDAGFEIRDSIAWLYGSGFPKSLDVSKAIDKAAGAEREVVGLNPNTAPATEAAKQWHGWGTALKPAFEPIVVGRKPLVGTVAANVLEHGTGALNIDGCRIEADEDRTRPPRTPNAILGGGKGTNLTASESNPAGRWPTNIVLDESQAAELDAQTGNRPGFSTQRDLKPQSGDTGATYGKGVGKLEPGIRQGYDDSGGASRFFPTFKYQAKAPASERPKDADGKGHPTVKPLALVRWLVRLVTPPGGLVLDPFAGSGTTGEACLLEGMRCVLIEREAEYLPLIEARLRRGGANMPPAVQNGP